MSRSGLEARFQDRFVKYVGLPETTIKAGTQAREVADKLKISSSVIQVQEDNIGILLREATSCIEAIDLFQRESGVKQVSNIPLPSQAVKQSAAKRLGYVKLSLSFMRAGLLHFMEENLELKDEIKSQSALLEQIAAHDVEVGVLGELEELEQADFEDDSPIIDTRTELDSDSEDEEELQPAEVKASVKQDKPPTPPLTPGLVKVVPRPVPSNGGKPLRVKK